MYQKSQNKLKRPGKIESKIKRLVELYRSIPILILFFYLTGFTQDSLYLVGSITGNDTDNPIKSVKGLGDVNGDGYDDLIVSFTNYVNIYLGNPNFELNPDYTFEDIEGFICPGDVNNDGYDDYILNDVYTDESLMAINDFILYFGGEELDTIPRMTFTNRWYDQLFSNKIEKLGDINNDGFTDFCIASPYNWNDLYGRVYIFLGGDSISQQPDMEIISPNYENFFGEIVTGIGDINEDGYYDFLVSEPEFSMGNEKVNVFYGKDGSISNADTILKENFYDYGRLIYFAGNIIGETPEHEIFILSGEYVFIYNGLEIFETINGRKFGFGGYLSAGIGGDINNDGYDDFLIGNTNYLNKNNDNVGGAFLFWGGQQLDTISDFVFEGENIMDQFGRQIGVFGDFNSDDYEDVFISADFYPYYENPKGKIYFYSYRYVSSIKTDKITSNSYMLLQNYPNPFNSLTTIKFAVNQLSHIQLDIYNSSGQHIINLINESRAAGLHSTVWHGRNSRGLIVASGIYIVVLKARDIQTKENYTQSIRKIMFMK